jgi:hypothetical protein
MKIDRSSTDLPDWIPTQIIWTVNRLVGDDATSELTPDEKAVAAALCIDERMQTVWREVFRKSESGGFLYPAKIEALNPYSRGLAWTGRLVRSFERARDDRFLFDHGAARRKAKRYRHHEASAMEVLKMMSSDYRQELASMHLYTVAFKAFQYANVVTDSDLDLATEYAKETIERLREVSSYTLSVDWAKAEKEFRGAALAIERIRGGPFHVKRRSRDDRARAFAIEVGAETKRLFGDNLCGVIATLANVSFDRRDLTNLRVREFIRNAEKQRALV